METEDFYTTNLNTVKEMILDEEKLVTYITLSREFCIHVNNSKKLLSGAIKKIREEHPNVNLNVNFVISGSSGDNTASTSICTENDLDNLRKTLKTIFYYHVYSVCKGSAFVDNASFLLLNKYEDFSLCTGIIKSKECIRHTSDEIGNLKSSSQEAIVYENKPLSLPIKKLKQEPKYTSEALKNALVKDTNPMKEREINQEAKIKTEVTSPQKESNNSKHNNQKTNGLKTQKGIASFFNKSNGLQTKKVTNGSTNNNFKNEKMDIDDKSSQFEKVIKTEVFDKEVKIESKDEKLKMDNKEPKADQKNKILNKIKKSSKIDKKRKRVLHVSDSEDDEENDPFLDNYEINNESDDEIPPTPSANNNIKITSGIVNPKKRRKVVDKTYTDEDGYVLTKKEEVYESCSENEEEKIDQKEIKEVKIETSPITKKNSPKKPKKKISPPQKGKQQTLNNFFQRK